MHDLAPGTQAPLQ